MAWKRVAAALLEKTSQAAQQAEFVRNKTALTVKSPSVLTKNCETAPVSGGRCVLSPSTSSSHSSPSGQEAGGARHDLPSRQLLMTTPTGRPTYASSPMPQAALNRSLYAQVPVDVLVKLLHNMKEQ